MEAVSFEPADVSLIPADSNLTAHFIPSPDKLFWDARCKPFLYFYLVN
ncbi:MAG: hypothetical protein M3Z35_07600 [Nitrospirota bacterium]|nr:hypothetical protein [Nitrospirota bacterium]